MPSRHPRKKKPASERRRPAPAPREELRAAPRAQLGRDDEARAYRPREDDASVEDPLGDWPEGS